MCLAFIIYKEKEKTLAQRSTAQHRCCRGIALLHASMWREKAPPHFSFLIYSPLNSFQHPLHYSFFLPFLGFFTTFYLTLLSRCCRCGRTYSVAQHRTDVSDVSGVPKAVTNGLCRRWARLEKNKCFLLRRKLKESEQRRKQKKGNFKESARESCRVEEQNGNKNSRD